MKNKLLTTTMLIGSMFLGITSCKAHEHTFAEDWSKDNTNHWHAATCEHTEEKSDLAAHTWDSGKVTKEATEKEAGVKTYACTVCKFTKTESIPVLEHVHTYSNDWSKDATNHWHAATCEHKDLTKDKAAHTWDSGKITKEPTEKETGIKTFTCTVCKFTRTEDIPQLVHSHTYSKSWTSNEEEHWHAATCEHKDQRSEVAKHTWNEGEITKPATDNESGLKTYTCSVCGYKKDETIPQLNRFFMAITDIFTITSYPDKIIVDGTISRGSVKVGDKLMLSDANKEVTIVRISINNKDVESASTGKITLMISGVKKEEVIRGSVLYTHETIESYKKFKMSFYLLTKDEGGKHTPMLSNYKPTFALYKIVNGESTSYVRNVIGTITLPEGTDMMMPGTTLEVSVELNETVPLEVNMEVAVRQSAQTIGRGTITSLIKE